MLAMCGGNYNSFFSELEKRRIDEVIYLFFNWKEFNTPDKNKNLPVIKDQVYEPLAKQ